ncbi:MAG: hypothetical protein IID46_05200 [Planctomycetes bacterium]|nr:hypothetical protein [Planctomycetota bacterium]
MLQIIHADIHLIDLQTRLPFKYGIATMTSAPHVFVRVQIEIDGEPAVGIAADHLPPKWFKKDPDQPLEDEIDEMLRVIEHAVELSGGLSGASAFDIWRQLDEQQIQWGIREKLPPLLSNFGTTLVERAVIEAVCKSAKKSFAKALRSDLLGIRLGEIDERLKGLTPVELLPAQPFRRVIARHTVGMADPLTDDDISAEERLDDGLPQSLAACIKRYGLKHFKIKVSGNLKSDIERLEQISAVIGRHASPEFVFTMDGNEQFRSLGSFQEFWRSITDVDRLQSFFEHLMFVEQPFHRDMALDAEVLAELKTWTDRPKLIIDESDSEHDSLRRALELGYHGTSHKNCKGVFHGIANACLLEKMRRDTPGDVFIMSGEDLANIGPVALLQDLAVSSSLGVESIERNGHHYFAGLSAFPQTVGQQVLEHHGDLYRKTEKGWPSLDIQNGELNLGSVVDAPLGVGFELDVEQFTPSREWRRNRNL